jgi:phenylalanyl-tRNA synthetase alpha chain
VVTDLFEQLKQVPQEDRRAVGQELNSLKDFAQQRFKESSTSLENSLTPRRLRLRSI